MNEKFKIYFKENFFKNKKELKSFLLSLNKVLKKLFV